MSARDLAIDDAADIDARLSDQKAAELDDERRLRERGDGLRHDFPQIGADRSEVEGLFAWEVRDAEAAPDVEHSDRLGRGRGQSDGKVQRLALRLANRFGAEVLRAAVDVKTLERESKLADSPKRVRNHFGIDAELFWAATHFHAGRFQLEVRINPDGDTRGFAQGDREARQQLDFTLGFDVDQDARI